MKPARARSSLSRLAAVVALGLLLAACAGPQPAPEDDDVDVDARADEAEARLADDEPRRAAAIYDDLAAATDGVEAMRWRIRAAEVLFDAGLDEAALDQRGRFQRIELPASLEARRRIIDARVAVVRQQSALALGLLPDSVADEPRAVRARYHETRARALAQRLPEEAAAALAAFVEAEALLRGEDTDERRESVLEATWNALAQLDRDQREALADDAEDRVERGWAELALTEARVLAGRESIDDAFAAWRERFDDHPGNDFVATLEERVLARLTYPDRIDVLLPLSGRLADAAAAIRDGMITAYYAIPHYIGRPELVFHDVGSDGADIATAYEHARDAGSDFVVGPLRRDAVREMAQLPERDLPVLALNYVDGDRDEAPEDFYQFGLRPEDEARQAAAAAIRDNRFNAVALTPANERGDRLRSAFGERFEELGGVLVDASGYTPEQSDYRRPIQRLLNIDDSRERFSRLRRTLTDSELEFEPRRRQDFDFIFLVAQPKQGRLAKPQLEFHRVGDTPVYATSDIFTGAADPDSDWDMNGLFFTEIPWLLDRVVAGDDADDAVSQHWPDRHSDHLRLFALGADAIDILPGLEQMDADSSHRGRTGHLSLTDDRRIVRELDWARFTRGRPQPVPTPGVLEAERMLGEGIRERVNGSD